MPMTKAEAAAKARDAKATKLEAAADVARPEAPELTLHTYRYAGGMPSIVVVSPDGTAHEVARGEAITLPHELNHTDFVKVKQ
jgi:hypothetical protein